jgi:hypothetical protein
MLRPRTLYFERGLLKFETDILHGVMQCRFAVQEIWLGLVA